MRVKLAYGKRGLDLDLDEGWNVRVIEPQFVPSVTDPAAALRAALRSPIGALPLRAQVGRDDRVGIIVNDITRATPNPLILRAILDELPEVPRDNLTLFIALGTHRPNTPDELSTLLGADISRGIRIVQNNAFDRETQVCLGTTSRGNEAWVNRDLMACSFRILTGFIEPHFFAGFSGGPKALMPGMGGQATVLRNHSVSNIANPNATWGITHGNPIWEEVHEIALMAGNLFLVNVALNRDKDITSVFAGDLDQAHDQGCEFVRRTSMVPVEEPFDIVLTTNSGYPLDLNLYQAVKGMSAAAKVVRDGGAILIAAECWDGIPEHGLYGQLLRESGSPQALLERLAAPGFAMQDQWQAQIQAQIQLKAEVYVHSDYLSDEQIRSARLLPAADLRAVLDRLVQRYGPQARICVLPEGPQTIPYRMG